VSAAPTRLTRGRVASQVRVAGIDDQLVSVRKEEPSYPDRAGDVLHLHGCVQMSTAEAACQCDTRGGGPPTGGAAFGVLTRIAPHQLALQPPLVLPSETRTGPESWKNAGL
jgi:hypothetical protein